MPPKFQSTFIPKGPVANPGVMPPTTRVVHRDLVSFLAKLIFVISLLLAVGVVGYKFYLNYSIQSMGVELDSMRQSIESGAVGELVNLNNRIVAAQSLIKNHTVVTPLFRFLEGSTPQTVRFSDFTYMMGEKGPQIVVKGAARSYGALAFESSLLNKNSDFKNVVFSDIHLDEKGNVIFTMSANVVATFISYEEYLKSKTPAKTPTDTNATTLVVPANTNVSTSTSTSTSPTTNSTQ